MSYEVAQPDERMSIGNPNLMSWRAMGALVAVRQEVSRRLRETPDMLSVLAAVVIAGATLWSGAELSGLTSDAIALSIAPVAVAPQSGGTGKAFCQMPAGGAASDWAFPAYACGTNGIAGPDGPVSAAPFTDGRMIVESRYGSSSIYAVMMANTGSFAGPGASGAEFRDGYAFNHGFIVASGLSVTALSRQCEAGFSPAPPTIDNPAPFGAGQASYAPGTPAMTPEGGFVCGNSHILDGDLDLPD
ncbi:MULTISPECIES: hypothetical protein [unclassified Acidiphilium]|jgi:hypothetical protein|uniref:hypothetical protein n=1 Tax=unclassified Acidiphilium TaxID=2617493 RepID=UPI001F48FB36|nr:MULTISPECIES: hypothetical protein [unclassified Acidiphilium]HQT61237.1 hypothetical protein [Acidiphilium sp.]